MKPWYHPEVFPLRGQPRLTKEKAPCCVAKRDALGRLPVGFCGPDCLRRPQR